MTRRPLALLVPTLVLSVLVGGCSAPAPAPAPAAEQPADPAVDVPAVEDVILAILPGEGSGLEISDETGTENQSFGSDWSEVDHDSNRVARVSRALTSPGWNDASGPAFYAVFEVVLMESARHADGALHDISTIARDPYSLPAEDGLPVTEYEAVRAPIRSDWPTGSIERDVRLVWDDGSRATGWIVYSSSGPYVALVWGGAVPDDASHAAMATFFDEHLPEFISGFRSLA